MSDDNKRNYTHIQEVLNEVFIKDQAAVENAITSKYGFLEGNNSRLKMIKRTMYGRASLPLLRAKILK